MKANTQPIRAEGQNPDQPTIVGGNPAELGQFKGVVKLSNGCGGSWLGDVWILTAAHCVPKNGETIFAEMGMVDVYSSTLTLQRRQIVQFIVHPEYNAITLHNDIALARVNQAFEANEFVGVFRLTDETKLNLEQTNSLVTATGWGATRYGGGLSSKLRYVDINVVDQSLCAQAVAEFTELTIGMLCAGDYENGKKDSCQGDSGGPLLANEDGEWTQLGIVSFGYGCGEPKYPGVYTRVSQYLEFIRSYVTEIANPTEVMTPTIGISWTASIISPISMTVDVSDTVIVQFVITNTSEITHIVPVTMIALGFDPGLITFPLIIYPGEVLTEHYVLQVTIAPPILTIRADGRSQVFVFKRDAPPKYDWEIQLKGYKKSETLKIFFDSAVPQLTEIHLKMHLADPISYTRPITAFPELVHLITRSYVRIYSEDGQEDRCTLDLELPPPVEGDWTYILVCPATPTIRYVDMRLYATDKYEEVIITGTAPRQDAKLLTVRKFFDWAQFLSILLNQ